MNTHKTGMRAVLAAAAAGALVLGSAGGAIAEPGKAKGPKASASETTMTKLQNVNIKRHKKIDLADVTAENVTFNLRAKVRYMKKTKTDDTLDSFGVDLAFFSKKVNAGDPLGEAVPGSVMLKTTKTTKNKFYAGEAVVTTADLKDAVVAGDGKAYLCTSMVDEKLFHKFSQQTRKRLGINAEGNPKSGKTVRDCVKVVNSADTMDETQEPTS